MERLTKKFTDGGAYCDIGIEDVGIKGINAPTYVGEAINKLAEYEDAEEQGLLLKPKVALGSFVYWDSGYWGIIPYKVCNISYSIHGFCYEICAFKGDELLDDQEVVDDDFGKYVFLTKEEAEQKLAEMKGE